MTDFETHPVGTADLLKRLRSDTPNMTIGHAAMRHAADRIEQLAAALTRDEVIARLVWACEEIASITVHSGGDVHGVTSREWQGAFQQAQDEARAALAAAKAVLK